MGTANVVMVLHNNRDVVEEEIFMLGLGGGGCSFHLSLSSAAYLPLTLLEPSIVGINLFLRS